jgi:RNA-dependent RNA polymerase
MRTNILIFFLLTSNILVYFLSNHPKRTSTSRYLIALLYYGGVKAEYFIELLHDAIEGAENARYGYGDALKRKL